MFPIKGVKFDALICLLFRKTALTLGSHVGESKVVTGRVYFLLRINFTNIVLIQ